MRQKSPAGSNVWNVSRVWFSISAQYCTGLDKKFLEVFEPSEIATYAQFIRYFDLIEYWDDSRKSMIVIRTTYNSLLSY